MAQSLDPAEGGLRLGGCSPPEDQVWGFFMEIISTPREMQALAGQWRGQGRKVVLVPTMGYFHRGHLSLMEYGRTIGDRLVVSLFVNPAQFGPQEDLARYPRDLDRDVRLAQEAGVDVLYTPEGGDMYPPGYQTFVTVEGLSGGLCGASRPGHFQGVATVVLKLFNQVEPQAAVFGEKDYQQLVVVKRMAADLDLPVTVIGRPIVREPDGLAMSSRNTYLSAAERGAALCLYRALVAARELVVSGAKGRDHILEAVRQIIKAAPYTRIDYTALVDPTTLQEVEAIQGEARLLLAVWVNQTRLIDNTLLSESRLCCV
jgi:pantoate--beta-alanine ligase